MIKNIIFDFDGTLVDSFDIVIQKFNLLAGEFNFRYIDDHEIDDLKNLTSKELIRHLKIPVYKIPKIILKARALMRDEIAKLPTNIGSIAVTWGFNSEVVLLRHQPHFIARTPEDILAICKGVNNL